MNVLRYKNKLSDNDIHFELLRHVLIAKALIEDVNIMKKGKTALNLKKTQN